MTAHKNSFKKTKTKKLICFYKRQLSCVDSTCIIPGLGVECSHRTQFKCTAPCRGRGATVNVFLGFTCCLIMENMDDVERVALVYMFGKFYRGAGSTSVFTDPSESHHLLLSDSKKDERHKPVEL